MLSATNYHEQFRELDIHHPSWEYRIKQTDEASMFMKTCKLVAIISLVWMVVSVCFGKDLKAPLLIFAFSAGGWWMTNQELQKNECISKAIISLCKKHYNYILPAHNSNYRKSKIL